MLVSLLACEPAPVVDSHSEAEALPSAWAYAPATAPGPTLDLATLEAGLAQLIELVVRIDPELAFAHYLPLLTWGDVDCPFVDPSYVGAIYWEDSCTSERGATFHGWVFSSYYVNIPLNGEQCEVDANYYGFSRVETPDLTWDGWGEIRFSACNAPSVQEDRVRATVRGDFRVAGQGWLDEDLSVDLDAYYAQSAAGSTAWLDGGFGGLPDPLPGASLSEVALVATGAGCTLEPSGRILLYGSDGVSYELVFGATGEADPACDGCGEVEVAGAPYGAVCGDFSPLVAWEGRPWR